MSSPLLTTDLPTLIPFQTLGPLLAKPEDCRIYCALGGTRSNAEFVRDALAIATRLKQEAPTERFIGLIAPSSAAAAAAGIGVMLAGKIAVFLNFTLKSEAIRSAVEQCGIRTILISTRLPPVAIPASCRTFALEEIQTGDTNSAVTILRDAFNAGAFPGKRILPTPDDPATVIFSSGSTGTPKGIVLTHRNLLANLQGLRPILPLASDNVILGALPFFHSFGFLAALCLPLVFAQPIVYHPNPMNAAEIGAISVQQKISAVFTTPTFLQLYTRRCQPEELKSWRMVITGAEKMRPAIANAFRDRFGPLPVEGYGCTELSPVVSINLPEDPAEMGKKCGRPGSVGKPLPNLRVRITHPQTGKEQPVGEEGLLEVAGESVMKGYLNNAEGTARVLQDGWYNTGDIARQDADGYLFITGRLSRFSKIGGEMVSHGLVEEAIIRAVGNENIRLAVTSTSDPRKGERLLVFHTGLPLSPSEIIAGMRANDTANICIPKPTDFHQVEALPLLASGKLDLQRLQQWGQQQTKSS